MYWQVLCQLDISYSHLGRRDLSQLRKCPHCVGLWARLWCLLLIACWCGWDQITVGGAPPELIVLRDRRKQTEQSLRRSSKQCSSWYLCPILPWQAVRRNKPFSPQVVFGHGVCLRCGNPQTANKGYIWGSSKIYSLCCWDLVGRPLGVQLWMLLERCPGQSSKALRHITSPVNLAYWENSPHKPLGLDTLGTFWGRSSIEEARVAEDKRIWLKVMIPCVPVAPIFSDTPHIHMWPHPPGYPGLRDLQRLLAPDRDLIGSLAFISAFRNEPIPNMPDK